jgi:pyridoxal phosphate enzyme (YggS family)
LSPSNIADALGRVRERIERAAISSGRDPRDVHLLAVSKTKSEDAIREAYAAGQRAFGENYAQELDTKARLLADLADLQWHFIGHLQSNKAKQVARVVSCVHTIDRAAIAHELAKRALPSQPISVFLEVNVAGESQKFGVAPSALGPLLDVVRAEPSLRLRGLMTMPPLGGDEVDLDLARRTFQDLVALRDEHGGPMLLPELSMGMSDDLEVAIACGATWVRVGTAIFGDRG